MRSYHFPGDVRGRSVWAAVVALATLFAAIEVSAQIASNVRSGEAGWVVIPVEQYKELRAKAYPTEPEPEPPPAQATLTRADYDLHVNGELARGRVTLAVDVLKDGWVRVPIPLGVLVREARVDGKLVSLTPMPTAKGVNQLTAVLAHPGRTVLMLDVALPVATAPGEESLYLPATETGITRAMLQLPRQGVDLRISGGLVTEKSEADALSKWVAYGRGNEPLTFTWRRKTEDHRGDQPLRMRGSLTELVSLGEDSTSVQAEVSVDVSQGAAKEVQVELSDQDFTVNQVMGAMVADWETSKGILSVKFLEPIEQNARLVLNGELKTPKEGNIKIPILRIAGVERDTSGIAVEVLGAGEIKGTKAEGLEAADGSDLGEMVASRQSPSLAAFRVRSVGNTTRSLSVDIVRYAQQAVLLANVEEARYEILLSNQGKTLVRARYAVRNNQRNFIKVGLPSGASVWSASLAGKPVRPGQAPDGSFLLPLEKARGGEDATPFEVQLLYLIRGSAWDDKGRLKLPLPSLDLPVSRTGLLAYYPPLFKISAEPGSFRTSEYEPPSSMAFNHEPPPMPPPPPPMSLPAQGQLGAVDEEKTRQLVDSFKLKSEAGRVIGILPVDIAFPELGPSVFLVSELTSEGQVPLAELNYQRDKKGGVR
jgi:hypothetical protein